MTDWADAFSSIGKPPRNSDLERRVEELERQIRELQARLVYVPVPQPYAPLPQYPQPWWPTPPVITSLDSGRS